MTGLQGRWQKLSDSPTVICDTGHNVAGISYIVEQLKQMKYNRLHMVIGMVNDKDVSGVLSILPENAVYYFTKASVKEHYRRLSYNRSELLPDCKERLIPMFSLP